MRANHILLCLLMVTGIANAQYQNFVLQNPDAATDNHTYVGRDYVRLLPGYHFSATDQGKTMNAKVQSALTTTDVQSFLSVANPPSDNPDAVTTIDKTKAVGQIPISSSVSPSGAKCYNVPIEIVPGRMGFQPNISLSYNSQTGNGVAGMGWNISGLSSIERVNKNVFFDGETEPITISNDGAFAIDGIRLIEKSRTTDQINYETVQGNIKVIAYLTQIGLNGTKFIGYFTVLYPNGSIGIFGTENNRNYAKLSFPITKLTDINGSRILFSYQIDGLGLDETTIVLSSPTNETYYIDEINYGESNNTQNFAKIKFTYEDRNDQIFSLQSTKSMVYRKRLQKIESYGNPDLIRTYQLVYSNVDPRITSSEDDVSRLTQISSFVNTGSAIADNLNPIKFYYGDNDLCSIRTTDTGIDIANFTIRKSILGKFCFDPNAYGLLSCYAYDNYALGEGNKIQACYPSNADIMVYQNIANPHIEYYSEPHAHYISPGGGFLGILSLDFDGNGKDEIVRINSAGITNENELINLRVFNTDANYNTNIVKNYTDLSFETFHKTALFFDYRSIIPKHFYKGNFTGNGKDEIICIPEKVKFEYNILVGEIDFGSSSTYILQFNNQGEINLQTAGTELLTDKDDLIFCIDIDGDSQTEILHVSTNKTEIYKYNSTLGLHKIGEWNITLQNFKDGRATFTDLNSDGNIDIVLTPDNPTTNVDSNHNVSYTYHDNWTYYFSNGVDLVKTINKNQLSNQWKKFIIQDIDEDNIPELLVSTYSSIGTGSDNLQLYPFSFKDLCFTESPFNTELQFDHGAGIIPVDVNTSVNSKELILVDYYLSTARIISLFKSKVKSNQISLMTNSLGIADKTTYGQLYQGTNYTPGTSASFPNIDFQGPVWVATGSSTMYNKQIIGNTTYNYTGAILNKQGLGFRGFSSMTATDLTTNRKATTEFDPYKMGVVTRQTSDFEESSFDYTFTDYSNQAGGNKKMKLLLNTKTVTDKLRGNTITTTYSGYDSYGNPGSEVTDYDGTNTTTTTVNYSYNNITNGDLSLIGQPDGRTVINKRNNQTFIQDEDYYYFDDHRLQYLQKGSRNNILDETNLISVKEYIYYPNKGGLQNEIIHNFITGSDEDNLITTYVYDTDNCMLKTKTDPQGISTTYTNDLNKRLIKKVTDYKGNTVDYDYDNWRRKNSEISTIGDDIVTTSIGLIWNPEQDINRLVKQTQTTTGQPESTVYTDAFGRETRKGATGLDGAYVYADKIYDSFGRLLQNSSPYKAGDDPLYTTYSYDTYDRPEKIVQPNGSITTYSYSGNSVTENKDGISTTKTTDATGVMVSSQDAGGTVAYVYRPDGQPDHIDAAGVITSFEYNDPYNRQTKLIDPSAGTVGTVYDDANHTVVQTWNSGKTITTVTNKFGQPISKTTPDFTTNYNYDHITYGRLTGSTSTNGTSKSLDYDTYGRLWKQNETVNGKTYQEVYEYNQGQISSITYNTNPGANPISYKVVNKYKNGYLYRLEDESENRLWEINSVNALGQETNTLLGNNLTISKTYTPEGLVSRIQTGSIQDMSFDFNRVNGPLNSRTDNLRGLSESFTYDNLYRLKSYGSAAYHATVDYNPNGNIGVKTDAGTYAYPTTGDKPYQLTGISGIPTVSTGLAIQQDITSTVYSRPATISKPSGPSNLVASFQYNDNYDRSFMSKSFFSQPVWSKYYFDGGKYEIEPSGNIQRIYLDGSPYTASVVLEKIGSNAPQIYYVHRDYLGSITQITDNSANLVAEYSYDAWGRMRNVSTWQPYAQGSQPALRFGRGYTGHEHLNDYGLINMNARLYDPVLGRFYEPDPFVNSGLSNDFNRYVYARNNPLLFTDPSGESWKSFWADVWSSFKRDFSRTFLSGGPGFEFGYNTNGGFFTNATYNGMPLGPSAYYNISNRQMSFGNGSAGFHDNISSITLQEALGSSIVQAEKDAKYQYYEIKQNSGVGWELFAGLAATTGSTFFYSKKYNIWMGKNFRIYNLNFHGNGSTGGMNKFGKNVSITFEVAGWLLGTWNAYSIEDDREKGEIGWEQWILEQGSNVYSTLGGLEGAAWSIGWESGRVVTSTDWYQNIKFKFYYNYWESQIGKPSQSNEDLWYYFYSNYK